MTIRRRFLIALGSMPVWWWRYTANAQTPARIYRIGVLSASNPEATRYWFGSFDAGIRDLGYVNGKNVAIEYRFADGKFERLPALAAELVQLRPDALLVHSTPGNLAAKQATTQIPIVMVGVADPVGVGLVSNLARPGGNITGITNISAELAGKRLEILKEIMPRITRVAVLLNPNDPNANPQMKNAEAAARSLGIQLQPVVRVRGAEDLEGAIAASVRGGAVAAIRMVDPLGSSLRNRTVELAAKYRLPVMYPFQEDVEAGGLISYGTNLADQFRRAATFVDKLFKGVEPGELPVEQPTKFELTVNQRTAKALGIKIPNSILVRADKVIE